MTQKCHGRLNDDVSFMDNNDKNKEAGMIIFCCIAAGLTMQIKSGCHRVAVVRKLLLNDSWAHYSWQKTMFTV